MILNLLLDYIILIMYFNLNLQYSYLLDQFFVKFILVLHFLFIMVTFRLFIIKFIIILIPMFLLINFILYYYSIINLLKQLLLYF